MKGIFFTIITFMIFLGMITYITVITNSNIQMSNLIGERISANRIYYTWRSVYDNMKHILNVYVSKVNDTAEINDTLPANGSSIIDFLKMYQQFINQTYRDPTIDIHFEDTNGNEITLNETTLDPKTLFTIKPMNINYGYPDYGKNELFIKSTPENSTFIKYIDLSIYTNRSFNTTVIPNPKLCPATYCLNFTLHIINQTTQWTYQNLFDLEFNNWIKINVGDEPEVVVIDIGTVKPPGNIVFHFEIIKSGFIFNTSTKMTLNTTDFYINLASILNVSTVFGKKVDNI